MEKNKVDAKLEKQQARASELKNRAKQDMMRKLMDEYNRSSQTPFQEIGEFVDPETGKSMSIWAKAPLKNR